MLISTSQSCPTCDDPAGGMSLNTADPSDPYWDCCSGCGRQDEAGLPLPDPDEAARRNLRMAETVTLLEEGNLRLGVGKVSDFYCEGVDAFELKGNRRVHSYGERQRKREAQGLDPDTGMFREYGEGGEDYN